MMKTSILALALVAFTAAPGPAAVQIIFDDGFHHLVDASNSDAGDGVVVRNSSLGVSTSVTIANGADLGAHGGYPGLIAGGNSIVRITGGSFNSDAPVAAVESSHVIVTSGLIGDPGSVVSLIGRDDAVVDVLGGTFRGGGLFVFGNAIANVMGGDFSAASRPFWIAEDEVNPVINIYGWGFNYPAGPIPDVSGTLTGVLADGTPIQGPFNRSIGTINLIEMPEPAVGCYLLGLLVCLRRSRRH